MANKKLPNFKKHQQHKKKSDSLQLLRKYSVRQCLDCIQEMNRFYFNNEINDANRIKAKPEFLTVAADMAIRVAKDKEYDYEKPSSAQCHALLGCEIELTDSPNNLIKMFGIGGLSLLASWQNRLHYDHFNMLGRMHLLY